MGFELFMRFIAILSFERNQSKLQLSPGEDLST